MVTQDVEFRDEDCGELLKRYKRGKKLGSGGQGQVFALTHRGFGHKRYAGKMFRLGSEAKREASIMDMLHACPGVAHLEGFVKERDGAQCYGSIVMELCGPSLFDRLLKAGPMCEEDAARTIKKLAETIQEIHSRGIVHRDLKPENVFLKLDAAAADDVVIGDFGIATDDPREMAECCGTGKYLAPEVIAIKFGKSSYTEAVDVWGLGLIAYELLRGCTEWRVMDLLRAGRFPDGLFSDGAADLLRGMLAVEPRKRTTLDRVLAHPWIVRHCSRSKTKAKIDHTKIMAIIQRTASRCGDHLGTTLQRLGKRPGIIR
ncbi:calcium-dependent protein kinase 19 [Selaginella moellendorffii]|nr:calcium-dependent protein kinase 19 [Selaginella moellendorffii]|eukprot:XP_002975238.2 calcium-dependent protein kinase 19 [Selaginella moellendorffii]